MGRRKRVKGLKYQECIGTSGTVGTGAIAVGSVSCLYVHDLAGFVAQLQSDGQIAKIGKCDLKGQIEVQNQSLMATNVEVKFYALTYQHGATMTYGTQPRGSIRSIFDGVCDKPFGFVPLGSFSPRPQFIDSTFARSFVKFKINETKIARALAQWREENPNQVDLGCHIVAVVIDDAAQIQNIRIGHHLEYSISLEDRNSSGLALGA